MLSNIERVSTLAEVQNRVSMPYCDELVYYLTKPLVDSWMIDVTFPVAKVARQNENIWQMASTIGQIRSILGSNYLLLIEMWQWITDHCYPNTDNINVNDVVVALRNWITNETAIDELSKRVIKPYGLLGYLVLVMNGLFHRVNQYYVSFTEDKDSTWVAERRKNIADFFRLYFNEPKLFIHTSHDFAIPCSINDSNLDIGTIKESQCRVCSKHDQCAVATIAWIGRMMNFMINNSQNLHSIKNKE